MKWPISRRSLWERAARMPESVIIPIALSVGVTVSVATATIIANVLIGLAVSVVVGFVSKALAGRPNLPDFASLGSLARDRTQNVRQPITNWRVAYGLVKLGGPITFYNSWNNNFELGLLITLAPHPLAAMREVYLNDEYVEIGPDGNVASGRWRNNFYAFFGDGTAAGDATLLSTMRTDAPDKWTADHKQTGHAKLWAHFLWFTPLYPGSLPQVRAIFKCKPLYDPRDDDQDPDDESTWKWSRNPALCVRDYLTNAEYGRGEPASAIDDDSVIAAANICEEQVDVVQASAAVTVDASADTLTLAEAIPNLLDGDGVKVSTDGSPMDPPAPLDVDTVYFWIGTGPLKGKLAASYLDALAGTAIDLADAGSGTVTLTRVSEPRYTCDGTFDTADQPKDILARLLGAMAGGAVKTGGKWTVYAGAWRAPTITLGDGHLAAPLRVPTRIARRDLYNGVKGVFVNPADDWQPTDFPAVKNATYLAQDQGEQRWKDIELPFTLSPSMAQRIAKIDLERIRQQISPVWPVNLTGLRLKAGDTVSITRARYGWSAKAFEIADWQMVNRASQGEPPVLGVDLTLRETAAAVYDWNSGEETALDPAPDSNLPNAFTVLAPLSLSISEALYETRGSAGVKSRATLSWVASQDAFTDRYEYQIRASGDAWPDRVAPTAGTSVDFDDIAPDTYDFRVRAVNTVGAVSDWAELINQTIQGLLAAPADLTGLSCVMIGGMCVATWNRHPDLDVRIGGKILVRHDPLETGASWSTSVSIGVGGAGPDEATASQGIPGDATHAILPGLAGTYFFRPVDSSGVPAANPVAFSTKGATVLAYSTIDTIVEAPGWAGVTDGTIVDTGVLKLDTSVGGSAAFFGEQYFGTGYFGGEYFGSDTAGGAAGVLPYGTYRCAAGLDVGASSSPPGPVRFRLRASITVAAENVADLIDSRGPVDEWADVDGSEGADVDAEIWVRETDDDPAGSPVTWSAWQRLHSGEYHARAIDVPLLVLRSADPAYNIDVSAFTLTAEELA